MIEASIFFKKNPYYILEPAETHARLTAAVTTDLGLRLRHRQWETRPFPF